ncbi:nickel/cobalt transporter [Amantichitinum ursilacus]|nr:hypothetical protein [Amantichitinum ursilacus]
MSLLWITRWTLCALLLGGAGAAWAAPALDYFGRPLAASAPAASVAASASAPAPAATQPQPETQTHWSIPAPIQHALATAIRWQSRLNAQLTQQAKAARDGHTWAAVQGMILLSFLYGVLHAIGPGHGKIVISGYFVSQRARVSHGLLMSATAALMQALVAIALVGVLAALSGATAQTIIGHAASLEMVSYAAIAALGLVMLNRLRQGQDACGHDHSKDSGGSAALRPRRNAAATGARRALGQPAYRVVNQPHTLATLLLTGGAVGLRPCSGAILVLLFCLANGIFMVGVIAALAMAAGVAITVSAISLGALGAQRMLAGRAASLRWRRRLSWAGAIVITLFGLLQALLLALGLVLPSAA